MGCNKINLIQTWRWLFSNFQGNIEKVFNLPQITKIIYHSSYFLFRIKFQQYTTLAKSKLSIDLIVPWHCLFFSVSHYMPRSGCLSWKVQLKRLSRCSFYNPSFLVGANRWRWKITEVGRKTKEKSNEWRDAVNEFVN